MILHIFGDEGGPPKSLEFSSLHMFHVKHLSIKVNIDLPFSCSSLFFLRVEMFKIIFGHYLLLSSTNT